MNFKCIICNKWIELDKYVNHLETKHPIAYEAYKKNKKIHG